MATEQQIPVIAARLVEHQKQFLGLPTDDAQWLMNHTKEAITLCIEAIKNRSKSPRILGDIICNFIVPTTIEKFVAKDKFKVDISRGAKVKIVNLSSSFEELFLNKIEDPFAGSIINARKLEKSSVDSFIIQEFGGKEAAKITLTEMYAAMVAQSNGEDGALLTNGWRNIFYIEDVIGTLCVASVSWSDGGWCVDADSVETPIEWEAGYRVFFRNFLVHQAA